MDVRRRHQVQAACRQCYTLKGVVDCDGQVLVCNDLLGMDMRFSPRFLKRYAELEGQIRDALVHYVDEVRTGKFPTAEHSFRGRGAKEAKITRL